MNSRHYTLLFMAVQVMAEPMFLDNIYNKMNTNMTRLKLIIIICNDKSDRIEPETGHADEVYTMCNINKITEKVMSDKSGSCS